MDFLKTENFSALNNTIHKLFEKKKTQIKKFYRTLCIIFWQIGRISDCLVPLALSNLSVKACLCCVKNCFHTWVLVKVCFIVNGSALLRDPLTRANSPGEAHEPSQTVVTSCRSQLQWALPTHPNCVCHIPSSPQPSCANELQ